MMSIQGLSIADAARELGISTRTVRRFIKAGKLKAELVQGTFGPEYRIREIPAELKKQPAAEQPDKGSSSPAAGESAVQTLPESPDRILSMLKELQERNMVLAAQLGAAMERIRNLENQVRQLTAPVSVTASSKRLWWQRIFGFLRKND